MSTLRSQLLDAAPPTPFDRAHGIDSLRAARAAEAAPRIFVHANASIALPSYLAQKGRGLEWTPERAVLAARPSDLVCVQHAPPEAWLEELARLGVGPGPGRIVVAEPESLADRAAPLPQQLLRDTGALDRIASLLPGSGPVLVEPFLATEAEGRLANALEAVLGRAVRVASGPPEVVEAANGKDWIRERARALGVPVAPGELVELGPPGPGRDVSGLEPALLRWVQPTGRAIVRGARSASASGLRVVDDSAEARAEAVAWARQQPDSSVLLVESMLSVEASPNLLMHLAAGSVRCVGVSDQLLDAALHHRGNRHPSTAETLPEMLDAARRLGRDLAAEGLFGLVGFDFVEYRDAETGSLRAALAELNPRINGASYPRALLESLRLATARAGGPSVEAFVAGGFPVAPTSFDDVGERLRDLFFDPRSGRGAVLYNPGVLAIGKLTVACFAPSADEAERLLAELSRRAGAPAFIPPAPAREPPRSAR